MLIYLQESVHYSDTNYTNDNYDHAQDLHSPKLREKEKKPKTFNQSSCCLKALIAKLPIQETYDTNDQDQWRRVSVVEPVHERFSFHLLHIHLTFV